MNEKADQNSSPRNDFIQTLEEFANAANWNELLEIISAHPVLLTAEAIEAMQAWAASQEDESAKDHLSFLARFLADCRAQGVDAVRGALEASNSDTERSAELTASLLQLIEDKGGPSVREGFAELLPTIEIHEQDFFIDYLAFYALVEAKSFLRDPAISTACREAASSCAPGDAEKLFKHLADVLDRCRLNGIPAERENWAYAAGSQAIDLFKSAERMGGADGARALDHAIALFRRILSVYTRASMPADWAMTQMNLATALLTRAERSGGAAGEEALDEAIACCRAALEVYTRASMPADWAATQTNLAAALQTRAKRSGGAAGEEALDEAIACYRAALDIRTRASMPTDWAMTQMNLAIALKTRAQRSGGAAGEEALDEAIACYRAALEVYTRAAMPADWAMTQMNLANALMTRAERSGGAAGEEALDEAIACYRAALEVYTRTSMPADWAMTQMNLATALLTRAERSGGAAGEAALLEAIACYRAALEVYTRAAMPANWAMTQMNLANALQRRAERSGGAAGEAALLEAIACYRAALEVYTRAAMPADWAMTQMNLANALRRRAERSGGAAGEAALLEAIACTRAALEVYTRAAMPADWAMTQMNLANALLTRAERSGGAAGEAALDEAIACYRAALEVFTRAAMPAQWARTQMNLAIALRRRAERSGGAAGEAALDEAIACYRAALEVYTRASMPADWAMTQMNLATALLTRAERSGGAAGEVALDEAIACTRAALEVYTRAAMPANWAMTQMNLANALLTRAERSGGAAGEEALDEAIACYRAALEVRTRAAMPADWAGTQMNLAIALKTRAQRSGGAAGEEALDEAIACYRAALEVYTRAAMPADWAMTQMNLANALLTRAERSGGAAGEEALDEAIACYRAALEVYTRAAMPADWAMTQMNLATALMTRAERSEGVSRRSGFEQAASAYEDCLPVLAGSVSPLSHLSALRSLARCHAHLGAWHLSLQDLSAAFSAFDLAFFEAESEFEREELLKQIGGLGALGALASVKIGDGAGGLALLERGRMVQLREMLRTRGAAMEELRGRDAAAYATIMDAEQDVRWRRQELAARESAPRDASVDAQSCETRDAELRKELRQARAKLKDLREAAGLVPQVPALADMLAAIPAGGALVAPLVTEFGALAFVVPAGVTQLNEHHVVRLEGLDGRALREQLITWLNAYQALIRASREAVGTQTQELTARVVKVDTVLSDLLGWLWDKVMGPVSEKLISFGIKPAPADALIAPELVVLPVGDFALLPLHAAWRQMEDGSHRTILDDYAVTSAPSLEAFAGAKSKAGRLKTVVPSLLAVVEPDALVVKIKDGREVEKPLSPLKASREIEGPALERLFKEAGQSDPHLLQGPDATRKALLSSAIRIMPSHLHFACHGGFNPYDPAASGLMLSGRDRLTVRDIITALSIHLEACRMAALSACETAMADTAAIPDELTGLVSAFLMAGTPFVEATLWSVFDATTALFMAEFYELMLKGIETEDGEPIPLSPVQANRHAVRWLKSLTHADVEELTECYKTQAEPDCGIEPSIDMAAIFAKTKQHKAISLRQDSTIRSEIGGEINPDYLDVEPTQADPANTRLSPFHWAALTAWGY